MNISGGDIRLAHWIITIFEVIEKRINMKKNELMDEILAVLQLVKDDSKSLEKIHEFLMEEIYEEPQPDEIPGKYKNAVSSIAENLLAGFISYFNPDTGEVEEIPEKFDIDPEDFEIMTGDSPDDYELKHFSWENCIRFEPLHSSDSYRIMERFLDEVEDKSLRDKLDYALSNRKPFANFKHIVESSAYRQQWFDFRQKEWEYYVWDEMKYKLSDDNA